MGRTGAKVASRGGRTIEFTVRKGGNELTRRIRAQVRAERFNSDLGDRLLIFLKSTGAHTDTSIEIGILSPELPNKQSKKTVSSREGRY
jgi:hypothetical protein